MIAAWVATGMNVGSIVTPSALSMVRFEGLGMHGARTRETHLGHPGTGRVAFRQHLELHGDSANVG